MPSGVPTLAPALASGGVGYDREIFASLAKVEAGSFWFRARNKLILSVFRRMFPHMTRYLEIGCGTGFVLAGVANAFPRARITGSEVLAEGLFFARERLPSAELLQMDARDIPYRDEFDVIGAFDVLEHIAEDDRVLASMREALRNGGGVALTVPQHPALWSRQDDWAHHVRRYRMGELQEKLRRAGFTVVFETGFVTLLLPFMLLSRLAQRKTTTTIDPLTELRLPPLLDRALEAVMTIERALIRLGVRFPIGGSVLVVAIKRAA